MKLIDLYVAEVGRRLPQGQREDIQNELRSTLEDALDDEARAQGKPPDEALAAEVLRRYGPPEKTAAGYLPPRYLIGPELFPTYSKVLASLLGVLVLVSAIGFGASLGTSPEVRTNAGAALLQALANLWTGTLICTGIITAIFAVYEWTSRRVAPQPKTWDPATLKTIEKHARERDPQRVNPLELTFETVFTVAALIVFNLYPQWIGINWMQDGQWIHIPMLAPAFFTYLPWLSLWWVLQIVLNGVILAQRRRTVLNQWLEMGLNLFRIVLAFAILVGPVIISVNAGALAQPGLDAQTLSSANNGLDTLVRVALGISTAIGALNLVKDVYRKLLRDRVHLAGLRGNS